MAMNAAQWLIVIGLPLLVAFGLTIRPDSRLLIAAAPFTALPALGLGLWATIGIETAVPWLLLGGIFGLDVGGQIFLLFTALLWTLSGIYAVTYMANDPRRSRFWIFYLLTMAGNLGLIISLDVAMFYACFVLMTFAGFGLIVHSGDYLARRAGKIYIIMAVLGEVMLLAGFLIAAQGAASWSIADIAESVAVSPNRNLAVALLIGGFGVKAGVIPLHIWLPLAHPVAPTPASAVLSGAMIKAGLFGWLRFLPLGDVPLVTWGGLVIFAGLGAAFLAALFGAFQSDPKTVLAYSSISQMGVMAVGVGVALAEPEAWPLVGTAIVFYALHHGLAKGALFLGVGVADTPLDTPLKRGFVGVGLLFAALVMAGAPLTSGTAAKSILGEPVALAPPRIEQWLGWLLPLTAIGTSVLMARFLYLVRLKAAKGNAHYAFSAGLWAPWLLLLIASGIAAWFVPLYYAIDGIAAVNLQPGYVWASTWPIIAGALILVGAYQLRRRGYRRSVPVVPPGDLLALIEWILARTYDPLRDWLVPRSASAVTRVEETWVGWGVYRVAGMALFRFEGLLVRFGVAGSLLIGLMVTLYLLVWRT
jgi:formate hydrogenlyase subunit 3/multisubunit Na+/H+ antiporter MnhD subunit